MSLPSSSSSSSSSLSLPPSRPSHQPSPRFPFFLKYRCLLPVLYSGMFPFLPSFPASFLPLHEGIVASTGTSSAVGISATRLESEGVSEFHDQESLLSSAPPRMKATANTPPWLSRRDNTLPYPVSFPRFLGRSLKIPRPCPIINLRALQLSEGLARPSLFTQPSGSHGVNIPAAFTFQSGIEHRGLPPSIVYRETTQPLVNGRPSGAVRVRNFSARGVGALINPCVYNSCKHGELPGSPGWKNGNRFHSLARV